MHYKFLLKINMIFRKIINYNTDVIYFYMDNSVITIYV